MSDPVSDALKQLEEDILMHGDTAMPSASSTTPAKTAKKPKTASSKPRAAVVYDVFNSMKNAESGAADKRAGSLEQFISSVVDGCKQSDVVNVQLAFVKPYGDLVLARVMPPPGAPVLKKLAKLSGKSTPLSAEKIKPSKDFIVLRKKKNVAAASAEKKSKIKKEKIEKKVVVKKAASAKSTDPAHARIKANLDKLKKKQHTAVAAV